MPGMAAKVFGAESKDSSPFAGGSGINGSGAAGLPKSCSLLKPSVAAARDCGKTGGGVDETPNG